MSWKCPAPPARGTIADWRAAHGVLAGLGTLQTTLTAVACKVRPEMWLDRHAMEAAAD